MELRFGVAVDCSDASCGALTRVVVDPQRREVTHVVVAPAGDHRRARLVPIDLVVTAGDRLSLSCLVAQWRELPRFEDVRYVKAESYWGALLIWPLSGGAGASDRRVVVEHLPPGEAGISTTNKARVDGHIGRLKGVVLDDCHRLTHFLLCEGHLLRKKEVAVQASLQAVADLLQPR